MINLNKCTLCPRECNVDRNIQEGYCNSSNNIKVARAALHYWEEPCISGEKGSGTVFFSGCNLHCIFCQNEAISRGKVGKEISIERLSQIFIELQEKGANNINLVTGVHFVPQIVEAIKQSRKNGLNIPIVYNSSGYEKVETLKLLEGLVDIYLPDMKYFSPELSKKYSNAEDYFEIAKKALGEIVRQVGKPIFNDDGIMKKGVIVRHLVLPGNTKDSKKILDYLYSTYHDDIYISIMNQFTPLKNVENYPEINRKLTQKEYDEVVDYAISLEIENGFTQEDETVSESFIPDFNGEGV